MWKKMFLAARNARLAVYETIRNDRPFRIIALSVMLLIAMAALVREYVVLPARARTAAASSSAAVDTARTPDLRRELHAVSVIYGRHGGRCDDYMLAEMTARVALAEKVDPKLLAAVVAVESSCNPLAISKAGAVGLTQVHVKTWAGEHGDWHLVNLFHPEQNLEIGAHILGEMIARHGLWTGVERYCGQGPEARAYVARIRKMVEAR